MRKLKFDEAYINKCLELVKTQLLSGAITYGTGSNIKIELTAEAVDNNVVKPVLTLTEQASLKLWALVHTQQTKEIAWHGTVVRTEDGFLIEDIIVFPQITTGATAAGDDIAYNEWLLNLDDETFDKLRFHGHSHVKMVTTPSAVDTGYQDNVVKDVKDFYIFGIFNQSYSVWLRIYDVEAGYIYDTGDIDFRCPLIDVFKWAKQTIKDNEITPPPKVTTQVYPRQGYYYDSIKRELHPELYGYQGQGYCRYDYD